MKKILAILLLLSAPAYAGQTNNPTQTLAATATSLGAVKVGSGLAISATGVLSATATASSSISIGSTITSATSGSVLFANPILAQDNNYFYYSATTHSLSVGTNGDFAGTDPINIYGQYDAYQANSAINGTLATVLQGVVFPSTSYSSSRGTGAAPTVNSTGDLMGGPSFWAYTGTASTYQSGGYSNMATIAGLVQGTSTAAAGLGGQIQFFTKADGGALTARGAVDNQGRFGIGNVSPNYLLDVSGTINTSGSILANSVVSSGNISGSSGTFSGSVTASSFSGNLVGTTATLSGTANIGNLLAGASTFSGAVAINNNLIVSGNTSAASWGLNGVVINTPTATLTDTTGTGTISTIVANHLGSPTFAATATGVTYTNMANLWIDAPVAGTNTTGTSKSALYVNGGERVNGSLYSSLFTVGSLTSGLNNEFSITGSITDTGSAATGGMFSLGGGGTLTDNTGTGTKASRYIATFGQIAMASTATGATYTKAATVRIDGPPTAGTNVTITNGYALDVGGNMLGTSATFTGTLASAGLTGTTATFTTGIMLNANAVINQTVAQLITTTGTYTPTTGTVYTLYNCWGSGGGGGSCAGNLTGYCAGSGGGGGAHVSGIISAPSATSVTIGTGGTGGAASGCNSGSAGGATILGATATAGGGSGGLCPTAASATMIPGVSGGTASGGTLANDQGGTSPPAIASSTFYSNGGNGGSGGASGGGGLGVALYSTGTAAGGTGGNYGGGGAGGAILLNAGGAAGGNGAKGACNFLDFVSK